YREQVNALGPQGVALVETLKVIGEKGVRITPDVMASGGGTGDGAGNLGTLLLLNLFRDQMKSGQNTEGFLNGSERKDNRFCINEGGHQDFTDARFCFLFPGFLHAGGEVTKSIFSMGSEGIPPVNFLQYGLPAFGQTWSQGVVSNTK